MSIILQKIIQIFTKNRLRDKFILLFIILALVPLLVLGSLTLYLIDLSHRRDVSNLELQLLEEKTKEIQKFFTETLGILELRVGFTQKSEIERSQQLFLLEGLLGENRAFGEVSFINLGGKESAKKVRGNDEPAALVDVSRLKKFIIPRSGKNYVSDIYYTLSGPFVTLASPVLNRNGDIVQILSAEANLLHVTRILETSRLGIGGYLLLFDRNGTFVFHRSRNGIHPGTDFIKFERVGQALEGRVFDGLGARDRYLSPFGAVPVVGAGKKIPGVDWILLVEWPVQDADALIGVVRSHIVQMIVFSIFAVILLASLFAIRLVRPIRELELGAREIEKGNFDWRTEIHTKDELQELGEVFNTMALGLKRLKELRNEFVFIAAHELRSPITAIRGYLSLFMREGGNTISEKLKGYITPVEGATARLIQLVNDILEIARSEAGQLKIDTTPCDISESINSIMKEVRSLANEKQVSLIYEAGKVPLVLGDASRIKEVIMNFVSNAIKYNHGGGWVKVYHTQEDSYLVTHVEDNGVGMAAEDQKHVFEKFFRSEEVKIKDIQGTGLGLFIVRELVERMRGGVWFQSEFGKGSKFSFRLPLAG